MAGNFQSLGGQKRSYLAALDPDTGTLTSWNPKADLFVNAVSIIRGTVYVGGAFLTVGGQASRGIAAFPISQTAPPQIIPGSYLRLPDGSVQFQISAPGIPAVTIQSSTNLIQWDTLQTLSLSNGNGIFTDRGATGYRYRFYRANAP